MILIDTSIWIDHLNRTEPRLVELLGHDEVAAHPLVIEELALGSIKDRTTILRLLENLQTFPVLSHDELLLLVDAHHLWGRGLSAVDVHLLGSVRLAPGGRLWTRDKRLLAACNDIGVDCLRESS